MRSVLFLCFCLPFFIFSQTEYLQYQSKDNQYYWKNRKPNEAYWQQDVHYTIKANMNDTADILSATENLIYFNNSPDVLTFVYFHLYSNAQTKNSYLSDLYRNNKFPLKYGKYRKEDLGMRILSVSSKGEDLIKEEDNTVMKVYLKEPLQPGASTTIDIKFETYFDYETIRNRMKMFTNDANPKFKHYDIVHWYPRVSVYDRKFGWDTEQHMDREFYGDFGSFHVEMTLPNDYIIDGTGELKNEEEMLPKDLRARLDISNFAKPEPNISSPRILIPKDGTKKTWIFSSINTHDVAYTADPTYRIGEVKWKGIRCIALVQENHAAGWQNAAGYVARIVATNSKLIGMFAYPKMIAADARDGMEYPMITLDGGSDPGFISLFTHEISHNWFFGMVGTNETYRAFMDEGFTQFYTAYTWEHFVGMNDLFYVDKKEKYVSKYSKPSLVRESDAYLSYYNSVYRSEEVTLNTHSDGFNGALRQGGGYGIVYSKAATMLYNLQYVLGDSLFEAAMQNYFNQWKMCHPYPEDMRNSFIQFTHADLNWFFDAWLETTKTIDYKVKKVKKEEGNKYAITFERKGMSMQMPIDFTVFSSDSAPVNYHIPNNWFVKKTKAKVLPRWIGWDKTKKTYTAIVEVKGKIQNVVIDTTNRLADINYMDNAWKKNIAFEFDSKIWNQPNRKKYELFARPALWFNGYDGVKFGAHANGNYLGVKHIFDATFYINTGLGHYGLDSNARFNEFDKVSFLFTYKTETNKFIKKSNFYANIKIADGLQSVLLGFDKKSNNDKNRYYIQVKGMLRDLPSDKNYLLFKNDWQIGKLNNAIHVGMDRNYSYRKGTGAMNINLRSPLLGSDYDFASLSVSCVNKNDLGKININTRFFAQYGTGLRLPYESMLYVYGANPEELMENKFTRAAGAIPSQFGGFGIQTNHFAAGGGLNLRGFGGYLLPTYAGSTAGNNIYKGTSGAAFNTEIEFGEIFGPKFWRVKKLNLRKYIKVVPYLFADAGAINTNNINQYLAFNEVMADAGAGFALTIHRWWKLQTAKPLTLRFEMPFFISKLPYAENDFVQMRWMVGVNRAF